MRILRINMRTLDAKVEETGLGWNAFGGRGLIAKIISDESKTIHDPLGANNKLIWAPGLLCGCHLSSCDRLSVGGISPLTRGIKESNAGGIAANRIIALGFQAIIVEELPEEDGDWKIIYINDEGVRFDPAGEIVGKGISAVKEYIENKYGKSVGISAIGLAGERQYKSACIVHNDKDGHLSRMSARGGMGAVMGSKRIKAIVLDPKNKPERTIYHPEKFQLSRKDYHQALRDHELTGTVWPKLGTAAMVATCNAVGALPTEGFSRGNFPEWRKISGEYLHDINKERGGKSGHACMPGCMVRCSNEIANVEGEIILSPLEYETIALMGSNLGISYIDDVVELNRLANEIGIDTIEIGAALGVYSQTGKFHFGDGKKAIELLREIQEDTELGRIIANGAVSTGRAFGINRIPAVKGQGMPGYDPRGTKGTGVTYATSPQGADHTCGTTIRANINQIGMEGQVDLSRKTQYKNAAVDNLGMCYFAAVVADEKMIKNLIHSIYGWDVNDDYFLNLGKETIQIERSINRRLGFTSMDDRIPEWMTKERILPHHSTFDIPNDELDAIFD